MTPQSRRRRCTKYFQSSSPDNSSGESCEKHRFQNQNIPRWALGAAFSQVVEEQDDFSVFTGHHAPSYCPTRLASGILRLHVAICCPPTPPPVWGEETGLRRLGHASRVTQPGRSDQDPLGSEPGPLLPAILYKGWAGRQPSAGCPRGLAQVSGK